MMSLTRKMLVAMGIEDTKIDQIIEAHTETIDGLKTERNALREKADKVADLEKQLEESHTNDNYAEKYAEEHKAFEEFKAKVASDNELQTKKAAYRELLTKAGIDPKRHDAIIRVTNFADVKVKEGAITNAEKLEESVKTEWADFIGVTSQQGSKVATPPQNKTEPIDYGSLTMAEYIKAREENNG